MDIYKIKKNPILLFSIAFWIIQLLMILIHVDNLIIISLIDFFLVIYFLLWFSVGKFKEKSKQFFNGLISPILKLIIFLIIPFIINYTTGNRFSGVIWTYSWLLLGALPMIILIFFIFYTINKDGGFDDLFFKKREKQFNKLYSYSSKICALTIALILFSPLIVNGLNFLIGDNNSELQELVNKVTKNSENDLDKTLALLAWFDRGEGKTENISNIYYRESDNEVLLNVGGAMYIFSKPPYFCTRGDDAMWIVSSLCGRCGEFGTLFNTMAYDANLTVRKVVCNGEDHVWNEVLLNISGNKTWVVVDPTSVNLPDSSGFDLPRNFMEDKVKGDLRKAGILLDEGNVSYVYAIYPNATDTKVDITYRYTDLINITVHAVDKQNNSISNVTINVISNNRLEPRETGLKKTTNDTGYYTFNIGGGDYTFKVEKGNLHGEERRSFYEDQPYHDLNIVLGR